MSYVKKKNLKTKKGKEKWRRNIDVTQLQSKLEEDNTKKHLEEIIKKKLKTKPNFYIDVEPNQELKPKKLDPNRFKKKIKENPSKIEKKLLKVYAKKIEHHPAQIKANKNENEEWEENLTKKPKIAIDEIKIANQLPQGGQSYNPSLKDHKLLLEEIENIEREKNDIKHAISNKINKPLTRKREPVSEKAMNHQFHLIKKYKKEFTEEDLTLQKRLELKEKLKKLEEKELKMGIVKKPKRVGKYRYEQKLPDFKLTNELSSNLRTVNPEGSVVRDAFDNVFKKSLIEPANPFGAKKRRSNIPKYKYHSTDRKQKTESEDKILGTSFNIYNY